MPEHIKSIKTVMVVFDLPIENDELPQFRGAVIETTKRNNDLFHNHTNEGLICRYPAIQHKKIEGKAALVCYQLTEVGRIILEADHLSSVMD